MPFFFFAERSVFAEGCTKAKKERKTEKKGGTLDSKVQANVLSKRHASHTEEIR